MLGLDKASIKKTKNISSPAHHFFGQKLISILNLKCMTPLNGGNLSQTL
jgi:hypothetical protein